MRAHRDHNRPYEGEPPDVYGREYFHVAHACGHSVYWNDAAFAMLARHDPCPWCGGETGLPAHPGAWTIVGTAHWQGDPAERLCCVRDRSPDGTFGGAGGKIGEPVIVRHMTGDRCCRYPPPPVETAQ